MTLTSQRYAGLGATTRAQLRGSGLPPYPETPPSSSLPRNPTLLVPAPKPQLLSADSSDEPQPFPKP